MHLALYRKYRPQTFDEVIGQDRIIRTLKNQIIDNKISHAYLFCGSRGTGKTSTAKIFARAINCKNNKNGSPCGVCDACKALKGENVDIFEIDAASNNGVDQIRDLREQVKYPPINGSYKVYIIDEVHMLSTSAFNALLKTLEEPPKFVVFILATTEPHKLPATILSRCMRFDFELVSVNELENHLKKICDLSCIEYDNQSINIIARAGEGSVRDMLSLADRCIAFCGNKLNEKDVANVLGVSSREILFDIAATIFADELGEALVKIENALQSGKTPLVLSRDLISHFRDLLFCLTVPKTAKNYINDSAEFFEKMLTQAKQQNYTKIINAIDVLSSVESELRQSVQPNVVLEAAIVKILANQNILSRLEIIEKKLQNSAQECEKVAKNNINSQNEVGFASDETTKTNAIEDKKESVAMQEQTNDYAKQNEINTSQNDANFQQNSRSYN